MGFRAETYGFRASGSEHRGVETSGFRVVFFKVQWPFARTTVHPLSGCALRQKNSQKTKPGFRVQGLGDSRFECRLYLDPRKPYPFEGLLSGHHEKDPQRMVGFVRVQAAFRT